MFKELFLLTLFAYLCQDSNAYLQVKGKDLIFNGKKIFLSGANIPWIGYDYDWGNGMYWQHRTKMNELLSMLSSNGGNCARVWVHFAGHTSPDIDSNGFVIGTDKQKDLIKELQAFLDDAEKHNVLIILCLFHSEY